MKRRRWPIDHVPLFDDVALNITFRCDLACVGCNRGSFLKHRHTPDMSVADVSRVLDEINAAGVKLKRLRIIGGEQTLHPDYQEITSLVAAFAQSRGVKIRMFSNFHSERAREMMAWTRKTFPAVNILGQRKTESVIFPPLTRYIYVDPTDVGIHCPHPCPIMGGRGTCGYGVDKLGYYLCPTAGTIDSILKLGARATSVKQMLDPEFVRHQAETLCSHCGNYMAYQREQLTPTWDHNGTPMSRSYHEALTKPPVPA